MFTVQSIENWKDLMNFGSIAEILRHYKDFKEDTLYDFFSPSRRNLSEVENYKGYHILKRNFIKSKRSKL